MTIFAERISEAALLDMMQIFGAQTWTQHLHGELTELWNICETRDQQILLKDLIIRFFVLDQNNEAKACELINSKFQEWGLTPERTRIIAVADSNEVDGSTAGLQKLKNKITPYNSWHSRFYPSIPSASDKIRDGEFVVIFDDFIGTGDKICKKIDWLLQIKADLKIEFSIHCVSFAGMRFGIDAIRTTCEIEVFSSFEIKKGISESMPSSEISNALTLMSEIEQKLATRYKSRKMRDYTMGYGKSECLYFWINDNCPNNVFPVFWWPKLRGGAPLRTLLRRVG